MPTNPAASSLPHLDYRLLFLASLLLSGLLIALDPLINRDAIIYLRSADAYLRDGFLASQQEYGRPLLPIGMALIHQLTGLSLVHAGLLLVSLFYALMCTAFVATVHTLGGDRRVQLIAAAVILFHPMLNEDRSSIMRDPGYWALLLLSFRALLLYCRQPGMRHQVSWFVCIWLASAFRFEGLFFATLAPLALLFSRDLAHRGSHCLRLLVPQLLALGAVLLAILASNSGADLLIFPAIEGYIDSLLALPQQFAELTRATGEAMLRFTAREDAALAVTAGLVAVLLLNICRALTWPWVFVLLWGRSRHLLGRFRADDRTLLRAHLLITLAYLAMFILIKQFMLERYANQLVIFLLLYLPFVLNGLWHGSGRWQKPLVIVLVLGMAVDSVHTGAGKKSFIRDATEWVRAETPAGSSLASNDKYIAYFSERDFDWDDAIQREFQLRRILAEPELWRDKDFLVMYVRPRDARYWAQFLARHRLQEMKAFGDGKRGRVSVVWLFPGYATPSPE